MISSYYNDDGKVRLRRRLDEPYQGKYVYEEEEIVLNCFERLAMKTVKNSSNEEIVSSASYSTVQHELKENDMINDRIVVAVERPKGWGRFYWRAYV